MLGLDFWGRSSVCPIKGFGNRLMRQSRAQVYVGYQTHGGKTAGSTVDSKPQRSVRLLRHSSNARYDCRLQPFELLASLSFQFALPAMYGFQTWGIAENRGRGTLGFSNTSGKELLRIAAKNRFKSQAVVVTQPIRLPQRKAYGSK